VAGDYVKRIEAAFEAFNERDFDLLVELCHPEVEWTPPVELPGSRTYHGRDGVREAVSDMVAIFGDLRAEAVRFEDRGERVVGLYHWRGTGSSSGASIDAFEVQAGFVCDFEDDLAKTVRFWTSWEDTLREAGVQPRSFT
jgi:ketosteroid isomerase-like protein